MENIKKVLINAITNPTTIESIKGEISNQVSKLPADKADAFSTAWGHLNSAVSDGVSRAKMTTPSVVEPVTAGRRKRTRKLKHKRRH